MKVCGEKVRRVENGELFLHETKFIIITTTIMLEYMLELYVEN